MCSFVQSQRTILSCHDGTDLPRGTQLLNPMFVRHAALVRRGAGCPSRANNILFGRSQSPGGSLRPRPYPAVFAATAAALTVSLTSCGSDDSGPTDVTPAAVSTPRGSPTGSIVSQVIGAGGGRVVSEDGVVTIDVPSGALASNVTITVQQVSNTAPGGFSSSYRLGPEGQAFGAPVTLTFSFPADVVDGVDVTSATIASQQADGT